MKFAAPIAVLVVYVGARYFLMENYKKVASAITSGRPSKCVSLEGSTTSEDQGAMYLVGTVRNGCETPVSNATIAFKVDRAFDSAYTSDTPIIAYAHDIPAGGTRTFKLQIPRNHGFSYRLDSISAF